MADFKKQIAPFRGELSTKENCLALYKIIEGGFKNNDIIVFDGLDHIYKIKNIEPAINLKTGANIPAVIVENIHDNSTNKFNYFAFLYVANNMTRRFELWKSMK